MGKAFIWLGGTAVALFIGYATVPSSASIPWYQLALWWGFVVTGALAVLTGWAYMILLARKRLNSLDILEDVRCSYWPQEKQLKVTLWFRDQSGVESFSIACVTQFGQQVVKVDDDVVIGGSYMGKEGLKSGHAQPIMVECYKHNVELCDVSMATIMTTIRPLGGVWLAKKQSKVVSVQVINR